jgi:hypothetical protein
MITDHRYDAGWPRNDRDGCIHWLQDGPDDEEPNLCGRPESEHQHSEYPSSDLDSPVQPIKVSPLLKEQWPDWDIAYRRARILSDAYRLVFTVKGHVSQVWVGGRKLRMLVTWHVAPLEPHTTPEYRRTGGAAGVSTFR